MRIVSTLLLSTALVTGCGDDSGSHSDASSTGDMSASAGDMTGSSDGAVEHGSCGSNTAAVVAAANAFLATLTTAQVATTEVAFTEAVAETWTNLPGGTRNGPQFEDLSTASQTAYLTLAQTALSAAGFTEFQNIRSADSVIASTVSGNQGWGAGLYHVAILGTPSTTAPWMLQFCGHHLVYNISYNTTVCGATPVFLGTEPPNFSVLPDGTTLVTGLVNGSSVTFVDGKEGTAPSGTPTAYAAVEPQRAAVDAVTTAILADTNVASSAKLSGTFSDVVYGINTNTGSDANYPFSSALNQTLVYPTGTTGRGVLYSSLTAAEQALVKTAIEAWVNTQASDLSTSLLADYESDAALAATYVGYGVPQGGTVPSFISNPNTTTDALATQGSYFRIDGPRVFIEFVVQEAVAFRAESWVHYHSIWRDKTADYGGEFASEAVDAGTTSTGGMNGDGGMGGMGGPPDGGMGGGPGM